MAKITLNDLSNITGQEASAIARINTNNTLLEIAVENTLSRDGTLPNAMEADFDMNSNDILNAGVIYSDDLFVNGINVDNIVGIPGVSVIDADVVGDNLIVTLSDASTIDAGNVRGAAGTNGTDGTDGADGATGPAGPIGNVAVNVIMNRSGSALATGIAGDIEIPFNATITAVRMLADQSGSVVVDIWKDTYANYPPTIADTIVAAAKPTISAATKSQDATLTGWTTSVTAGDILRFNIDSCTSIRRLDLSLTLTRV